MTVYEVEKSAPYYDQLYHTIKKMIFNGDLKPGQRIVESRLARELNVSRSPIREAIRALEKEGLIITNAKSHLIVYEPTPRDVTDVYQCRMALESYAVKLTILRATDEELDQIGHTLDLCRSKIEQESFDQNEVIQLNVRFHNEINRFSGNKRLEKQIDDLKSLVYFYRVLNFQGENREWEIYREHIDIFQKIKERDVDAAVKAMNDHLDHDYRHFQEVLRAFKG